MNEKQYLMFKSEADIVKVATTQCSSATAACRAQLLDCTFIGGIMNNNMLKNEAVETSYQNGKELLTAREGQDIHAQGKGVCEDSISVAGETGVETEGEEVHAEAKRNTQMYPWKDQPYKTVEEFMEAIGDDGGAELAMVPRELMSPEVCMAAVKADKCGDYPAALFYVPEGLKTPSLCLAAVTVNPYALEFVPEELKTLELCKVAVKGNPMALMYAPAGHAGELIDFIKV